VHKTLDYPTTNLINPH